jgi:hypothetical protein
MLGDLHRHLVVTDENELHLLRHRAYQLAEAPDIGIVERGVDLVEHTEGRRVELEDGEHQGYGGQGLLAAREQVDAGVALAGRARHDCHPGFEQILVGQFQIGLSTAEQTRKELLEALIDLIIGLFETAAGLAVDLADRLLQGLQRTGDVVVLGIEIGLALGLFLEFIDGGQVDRAQTLEARGDLAQFLLPDGLGRRRVE